MKSLTYYAMIAVFLMVTPGKSQAATLTFDFEEGAFGTNWFNLSSGSTGTNFGFSTAPLIVQEGTYSLGPGDYGARDFGHDPLHVQSIAFLLDGSGDLTFNLKGGKSGTGSPPLGSGSIPANVLGVALTRESDGVRVLSANAKYQSTITTITWGQSSIQPFANEAGETWTLDIYDTRTSGGWNFLSLDSISVPGTAAIPEPSGTLLSLLGIAAIGLRRRRS